MGIGTSLGAYFETPLDHHAGNEYVSETGTGNPPLYLDDNKIPFEGEGTRHDRYREDEPGVLEWIARDEKNAVKDRDKQMEKRPEDILSLEPTHDNNVMTDDVLYKRPGGLVHKVSDIKTASSLVTITDEDIDKGMNLGLSFSGGGLSTKTDIIKDAALRVKGEVFTGANHYEAYEKAVDKFGSKFPYKMDEGFTTKSGEFVSREKALEISGVKDSAEHPELHVRSSEYWRNRIK